MSKIMMQIVVVTLGIDRVVLDHIHRLIPPLDWIVKVNFLRGTMLANSRNAALRDLEYDWLLFIDDDVLVNQHVLDHLATKAPDSVWHYPYATSTASGTSIHLSCGSRKIIEDKPSYECLPRVSMPFEMPVEWCGMGCTAIPACVKGKLEMPFFDHIWIDGQQIYEDVRFCERCNASGIPIIAHWDPLWTRHLSRWLPEPFFLQGGS